MKPLMKYMEENKMYEDEYLSDIYGVLEKILIEMKVANTIEIMKMTRLDEADSIGWVEDIRKEIK